MANWFSDLKFRGDQGGLGMKSWDRAIDAGYTPRQVAEATEGAGLSVGWRLRDLVGELKKGFDREGRISDLEGELGDARGEASKYKGERDQYLGERDDARGTLKTVEGERDDFSKQLKDYQDKLEDYKKEYTVTAADYGAALTSAGDWEGKYTGLQQDYETAKALADAYREESVSRQLSGLQGGRTATGGQFGTAGLAGGRGAISRSATDREDAVEIEKKISAEDSVLSKKGPVVTLIKGGSGSTPSQSAGLVSGGSRAGYYAGRFG